MSMRINSLFEHDASMKRQAEEVENQNMASSMFENSAPEAQQQQASSSSTQNKSNLNSGSGSSKSATRHRASIACASCRDRRIRVSVKSSTASGVLLTSKSVSCLLVNGIVRNVNDRRRNVSLEMMMKENGSSPHSHFWIVMVTFQANL